ncbi:MAG: hypothetical protein AAF740_02845 [Bacteroidota bacterium]
MFPLKDYQVRLFFIALAGIIVAELVAGMKYENNFLIEGGAILIGFIGIIIWLWSLVVDVEAMIHGASLVRLSPTACALSFAVLTYFVNYRNQIPFEKPTLLRYYYDGDYNGTALDFKDDGTYIFEDMAIGFVDYSFGTYEISGDTIKLKENPAPRLFKRTNFLISDNCMKELSEDNQPLGEYCQYRIIEDHRN